MPVTLTIYLKRVIIILLNFAFPWAFVFQSVTVYGLIDSLRFKIWVECQLVLNNVFFKTKKSSTR